MINLTKHQDQFPSFPVTSVHDFIIGWWFLDLLPDPSFHGRYPPGYYQLVSSLMTGQPLHIFSGTMHPGVDINPQNNPDFCLNCEDMSSIPGPFDYIMADPPYFPKDAEKYGYPLPNKASVMHECHRLTNYVVWLDVVRPPTNPLEWKQIAQIGVDCKHHIVRVCSIFERR